MFTKKQLINKRVPALFLAFFISLFIGGAFFLNAIYVPVILMYHSVEEEGAVPRGYVNKLNVTPQVFGKQMEFLHKRNFKVISLVEFIERIKARKKIPSKTIAITFDDGLLNNYANAYPVLKRYGFPATIFVAADFIGKENFLTLEDIKIMQSNNISIGSHTLRHVWLPSLDKDSLTRELFDSKKILEAETGKKIETLSYPLGAFNRSVQIMAKEAGYIGAVSTNPGKKARWDDAYALKRIRISMSSLNPLVFWVETSGYYTFIKETRDED